ncbi:MAG: hypothetical protein MJZ05_04510 [Fibrobacter sp.]|nr:hypothetical protein [Fibrobacter sp.]
MNIQKFSKISKVTQAALLSLSLATFFCACTGANVAGTDEHGNSIADGNTGLPDKDSENVPQHGNNGPSSSTPSSSSSVPNSSSSTPSSSSIAIAPQSSSSGTGGSIEKNDLDELLEAADKNLTLGNAVDCICGTFLTAETELGKLEYKTENHYQYISCEENNGSMEYYRVTKEFYEIIKVFYSVNPDEQEFFKDNCSNELGTYKVSDNRATCTLAMTQDYKDPNWINMKDLVISHCME